jgi:acyl-CoA dehydrogenase
MDFFQAAPRLRNTYTSDALLRESLDRLSRELHEGERSQLFGLGELAAGDLFDLIRSDQNDEPQLTHFDAWGLRIDHIELSKLWQRAMPMASEFGLVASAYDMKYGELARVHQFAMIHLFHASSGFATCPLAMTDGAAKALKASGNQTLNKRALPRLLSRDASVAWTSGQWMTERTGGSDVGISETIARPNEDSSYGLYGTKWFTSATTSQMALTLARPCGNPPGGSGLALFYLETRDEAGALNGITIHRLKDKLGTRHVPTAELLLQGARAHAVVGLRDGIKNIAPMLSTTRTWNAACAASQMRRCTDLAKAYAKIRVAFGAPLIEKPLHRETLAWMEAETAAAFLFALRTAQLLGREEHGCASEQELKLLRLLTPIVKLLTAKQAVSVASEALESMGGAGYVENTGFPHLLRDSQVFSIWEGTTNVLSLDLLRAIGRDGDLSAVEHEVERCVTRAHAEDRAAGAEAQRAVAHASAFLARMRGEASGPRHQEAAARAFALTLGRALELALLVEHSAFQHAENLARTAGAAARRLVQQGIDTLHDDDPNTDNALLCD